MKFKNNDQGRKELFAFIRGQYDTYRSVRHAICREMAEAVMLDAGIQWIRMDAPPGPWSEVKKYVNEYNPDRHLRVTINRITRLVQKASAATHPIHLAAECLPPAADLATDATVRAQVFEDITNTMIDTACYRQARVDANYRRTVAGTWGFGLAVQMGEGGSATDVLEAFDFDPTHLTLDPHVQKRDLSQHDWVMYTDVWTLDKLRRHYPSIKVNEDDLSTVGALAPMHTEMARFSYGQVFGRFLQHSTSKGVLVHQLHVKDTTGRFNEMYVVIDTNDRDNPDGLTWANQENPTSPMGGNGLPLALLHGHPRPNSMWSRGDVWMLKGDQQRINLLGTLFFRCLQRYGWGRMLIDTRTMPQGETWESYRNTITNQIGGLIPYQSGTRDRPGQPPTALPHPQPPAFLLDLTRVYEENMVEASHRAGVNFGEQKSHVTNDAHRRAVEESDQVLGIRAEEDTATDEAMLGNLLGTAIRLAKGRSPRVLASLKRAGFGPEEFAVIAGSDPDDHGAVIQVRNIRYRSENMKRSDLVTALRDQAITPAEFRREMAAGIDSPVLEDDRYFVSEARRAALRVARGEPWQPLPLGEHAETFIREFRKMMVDRKVAKDPAALQRLSEAVIIQQQLLGQELAAAGLGGEGGAAVNQQPQPEVFDLNQALDALATGVQPGVGQGVPAAAAG